MPTVFLSHLLGADRLAHGPAAATPSAGPWDTLARLYAASLAACGCRVQPVVRPEIYQTAAARQVLGVQAGDWHLAVKPIEHVRPFHGLPNVFVCDWPLPELATSMRGGSPFSDHLRLLRLADAVLCCTEFTAATLRRAGLDRVLTLPPSIPPLPARRTTAGALQQRFLCAADAEALGRIIEGFSQAAARRPDLRLVVYGKASAPIGGEPSVSVADGQELASLLHESDFFLHAAASGLSVPLAQAILAGAPLLATLLPEATAEAVREAVLAAAELDAAARAQMAALARDAAERRFGMPAFAAGLAELDRLLAP